MDKVEFKAGQKVNAESKRGVRPGVVVSVTPGPRGSFIKVNHGEAGEQQYRPSKVALA